MAIKVVGAGLGRTGTHSLKIALEQLLGGRCYHMIEVFGLPEHIPLWTAAAQGNPPDWADMLTDFDAIVDWPGGAFYRELSAAFPDAPVLLSTRPSEAWWTSAHNTIFQVLKQGAEVSEGFPEMIEALFSNRFTMDLENADACIAAYERHNAEVRASVPADRLVEWSPGDGWGPLCAMLGVSEPSEPFPHVNTTEEFRAMMASGGPPAGPTA
jgi:hypothetical protein